MSTSAHGSRVGAIVTLVSILSVIGVVVYYAVTFTGNVNRLSEERSAEQPSQSPDLQNISDQFDEL